MLKRILVAASIGLASLTTTVVAAGPAGATTQSEVSVAAPCPYSGSHPSLAINSNGEPVRHLQCLLNRVWGYTNVAMDAQFGPITRSAVIAHQRDCGITADGIVGPVTWSRLHPDTTTQQCID